MTNQEAIEIINRENNPNDKEVWDTFPEYREALDMAINALSAIDDIKAEIDAQIDLHDTPFEIDDGMDSSFCDGLNKAKEIIDKHMKGIERC